MQSTIFLNNITVIDHAFINNDGKVIGGSYNASFLVSGNIKNDEKVVVDFSTIKKDIKGVIDRHTFDEKSNGFDHKLWLIDGFSQIKNCVEYLYKSENYIKIETDAISVDMPINSLKWFKLNNLNNTELETVISNFIVTELRKRPCYDLIDLQIKCHLNTNAIHPISQNSNIQYFRYVHGLKNSSSYGCRNLNHGHLSYIITDNNELNIKIAEDLNNTIFINRENIIKIDSNYIKVEYILDFNNDSRHFITIYDINHNKIVILDTETTIEFLAKYVKEKYQINSPIFISEGLSKGAYE